MFADRSVCAYDPFNTIKDRDFHVMKPFLQQMICMGSLPREQSLIFADDVSDCYPLFFQQ